MRIWGVEQAWSVDVLQGFRLADQEKRGSSELLPGGVWTMNYYTCPVCGFGGMLYPPNDYNICSCCGTEFGLDDVEITHRELRREWLRNGAPWFSDELPPPFGWNPFVQLVLADLDFDETYKPKSEDNRIESQDPYRLTAIA
jgi:hypothetical protein